MKNQNQIDLDIYIKAICDKAGVSPRETITQDINYRELVNDIFNKTIDLNDYSRQLFPLKYDRVLSSITFRELLSIIIIQNWDPFAISNDLNEKKFIALLKDFNVNTGLQPESNLLTYINYIQKYNSIPHFTANIINAENISLELNSFHSSSSNNIFIFGEPGTNKNIIADVILRLKKPVPVFPEIIDFLITEKKMISNLIVKLIVKKNIKCPSEVIEFVVKEVVSDNLKFISLFNKYTARVLGKSNLGYFSKLVNLYVRGIIRRQKKYRAKTINFISDIIEQDFLRNPDLLKIKLKGLISGVLDYPFMIQKSIKCSGLPDEFAIDQLADTVIKNNYSSINDFWGKLREPLKESISVHIQDVQKPGDSFREQLFRFINYGEHSKIDKNDKISDIHSFVCEISTLFDLVQNSKSANHRLDMNCISEKNLFFLYPIRYLRMDIPFLIYLFYKHHYYLVFNSPYQLDNPKGNAKIYFPWILLKYWIAVKPWHGNFKELEFDLGGYISRYLQLFDIDTSLSNIDLLTISKSANNEESSYFDRARKDIFYKLLDLVHDPEFKIYISSQDLKPYEVVSLYKLLSKPYLYYALRYFNEEKGDWDFDPGTIKKLLAILSPTGMTKPRDLFGELYGSDLIQNIGDKKGETGQISIREPNNIMLNKRPAISPKTLAAIKHLILPEDVSWGDLSIKWSDENCIFHLLKADYGDWQEVRNYEEMGFGSQRPKGKPIKEWESVLGRLAENNGRIYVEENDKFLPQEIEKANGRLEEFFKIKDNLIVKDEFDKKNPFYYSKFKIQKQEF